MKNNEESTALTPPDISFDEIERVGNAPAATRVVGDWLLTFAVESTGLPTRLPSAPWRSERHGMDWQLRHTLPTDGWRGMPLAQVETPVCIITSNPALIRCTHMGRLSLEERNDNESSSLMGRWIRVCAAAPLGARR